MNLQDFLNNKHISKHPDLKISKEDADAIRELALGDSYQIIKYLEHKSQEQEKENQKNYNVSLWAMIFGAISTFISLLSLFK